MEVSATLSQVFVESFKQVQFMQLSKRKTSKPTRLQVQDHTLAEQTQHLKLFFQRFSTLHGWKA
jgi:hypothetical protein